ncbi:MAG: SHOCT-like domain-containing protein, partial [Anaerolineales bacterium]
LSYPTIRNRLHEVIRAMGYQPGEGDASGLTDEERRSILEALERGEITYEDAMRQLEEGDS